MNLSTPQRIALFLAAIGGIIWLGGLIVRAALGFDLFIAGTLTFKPDMPALAQAQTLRLFARTSFYTICGYGALLLIGGYLWLSHKAIWQERGGLFIGGMLVVLYIPIECWQIYYDIELIQLVQYASYNDFPLEAAKQLLVKRITLLSGAGPFLSMLGYLSSVFCLIVQPMRIQRTARTAHHS
ncbi:MAG: hypothetical protein JNN25_00575 [Candidatus Kapabacteria bacterium]|nr:hypothetical protein [Candidatus Kapabacteria bacterium]